MFEFSLTQKDFLNEFYKQFSVYVNKSYKFTMSYVVNPTLSQLQENERLVLIVLNKAVYQNMYSFLRLNDSNMQLAAFACLEEAVNAIRLYGVLSSNPEYMGRYITDSDFSLEACELEILEEKKDYKADSDDFSLREFSKGLSRLNSFQLKNVTMSSQLVDGNLYLGLSCGEKLSDDLQNEIRKNLIGAYLSLQTHVKMFFNGGIDSELEELEENLYAKFLEYIRLYS